jgi:RNA polymerase sigma factor (TIGR02999 family)
MATADATALFIEWRNGNRSALDELFPLVYEDLRRRAHACLRGERDGHTLGTTALVHETYIKLLDVRRVQVQDRAHFLALASTAMRRVLVSYARRHRAAKRGGGHGAVTLDAGAMDRGLDLGATWSLSSERAEQMLALDRALEKLETLNGRLSRVVELRFFGGMSVEEAAEALELAATTVKLDWAKAKAWLYRELAAR